jgi:hypothetical protein
MGTIELSITDARDPHGETRALYKALLADSRLRSARKELTTGAGAPEDMGADELIRFVLESPEVITAAASCISAWLAARSSKITLIIKGPNREEIVSAEGVDVADEEVVRRALDIAQDAPSGPHS